MKKVFFILSLGLILSACQKSVEAPKEEIMMNPPEPPPPGGCGSDPANPKCTNCEKHPPGAPCSYDCAVCQTLYPQCHELLKWPCGHTPYPTGAKTDCNGGEAKANTSLDFPKGF